MYNSTGSGISGFHYDPVFRRPVAVGAEEIVDVEGGSSASGSKDVPVPGPERPAGGSVGSVPEPGDPVGDALAIERTGQLGLESPAGECEQRRATLEKLLDEIESLLPHKLDRSAILGLPSGEWQGVTQRLQAAVGRANRAVVHSDPAEAPRILREARRAEALSLIHI